MSTCTPRIAFESSRTLDFFTTDELTAQSGATPEQWPLLVVKELVDNAVDAAESAGIPPIVEVHVDSSTGLLTVSDNGPGLPRETLLATLDYDKRVSTNSRYASPTRGQQGNATKCVIAVPYVLDGERGVVEVETANYGVRIEVTIDEVGQQPRIAADDRGGHGKNGTLWRLHVPCHALESASAAFLPWLTAFSAINPHVTLRSSIDDVDHEWLPSVPDWHKWVPSSPIPPHWYDEEDFRSLIAAWIHDDRLRGRSTTVRDLVRTFAGLKGTKKSKAVCEAAELSGRTLSDLHDDGRVDTVAAGRLLESMKNAGRPPAARKLGVLGRGHLAACCARWGGDERTFRYKCLSIDESGVPYVVEAAFVHCPERDQARIVTGVNWSRPVGGAPFDDDVLWLLNDLDLDECEPVVLVLHVATPKPRWSDRGKGHVSLPESVRSAVEQCLRYVALKWHEHRNAERRADEAAVRRWNRTRRRDEISLKKAVRHVLEDAIEEMHGPRDVPFKSRNLYYSVRKRIEAAFGIEASKLTQKNFDRIVDDWEREYGVIEGHLRDPRGYLVEPHTGRTIPLGTREVEAYEPPLWLYDTILFIEKKGFQPMLEAVQLAERFDVAICYGEGYAVDACKVLLARAQEERNVTILCVHDADVYGKQIAHTLQRETLRSNRINVIDVGLSLDEAIEMGLGSESFHRSRALPADLPLTETEREWWEGVPDGRTKSKATRYRCRRVELNAMHPEQFVDYLERKLREHGCDRKVVPPVAVVEQRAREVSETRIRRHIETSIRRRLDIDAIVGEAFARVDAPDLSAVPGEIEAWSEERAPNPWSDRVAQLVEAGVDGLFTAIESAVERAISASRPGGV